MSTPRTISKEGPRYRETRRIDWYKSQAFEERKALVAGRGSLLELYVVNNAASTRYVYVFDNSASAAETQLVGPFVLVAGGYLSINSEVGFPYEQGVVVASSTSLGSYVASGAADLSITGQWEVDP